MKRVLAGILVVAVLAGAVYLVVNRSGRFSAVATASAADIAAAQAEIHRALAHLDLVSSGVRPETIAVAQADVAGAQAALEHAQVALDETILYAPSAGTAASLDAKVGEQVAPGFRLWGWLISPSGSSKPMI